MKHLLKRLLPMVLVLTVCVGLLSSLSFSAALFVLAILHFLHTREVLLIQPKKEIAVYGAVS